MPARHGATVVVNYRRDSDAARRAVDAILAEGGRAWPYPADVTDSAQVEGLVAATIDRYGRLDVLVNNVGMFLWQDVDGHTDAQWDQVIASNLSSVFYCTRAALPAMRARGWGRIVNLGVTGGQHTGPAPHMAAYEAAKAGMIAFVRSVALEEARHGITINVVCPGVVPDTERSLEEARAIADPGVPAGRPGTWEDVAHAVLFFTSPQAAFVTGAVLEVNGGWRG